MALWRDIAGYEGMYLVSDEGEIISLPRTVLCGRKTINRRAKLLKPHLRGKGRLLYPAVTLSKDGESKSFSIHRLVADAFIPNPDGLPEVNHKDENPLNNRADNLEWCTHQYNIDYSKSRSVAQITNGKVIAVYKSIADAGRRSGVKRTSINNVLTGWATTAGGCQLAYCD